MKQIESRSRVEQVISDRMSGKPLRPDQVPIISMMQNIAMYLFTIILIEKHPSHPKPLEIIPTYDPESNISLSVTPEEVQKSIKSFPSGSVGGFDALWPQILKDLTHTHCGNFGSILLKSTTDLCNLMLKGLLPDEIGPLLYGA